MLKIKFYGIAKNTINYMYFVLANLISYRQKVEVLLHLSWISQFSLSPEVKQNQPHNLEASYTFRWWSYALSYMTSFIPSICSFYWRIPHSFKAFSKCWTLHIFCSLKISISHQPLGKSISLGTWVAQCKESWRDSVQRKRWDVRACMCACERERVETQCIWTQRIRK